MERRKAPYSLQKRPTIRKNRSVFYAQFRNETGAYVSAVSTGCSNRDDAVRWCEQRLKNSQLKQTGVTFQDYAEGFWKRGSSYVEGRIAHGYSLSAGTLYVANIITNKHVIPKWGAWRLGDLTPSKIDSWIVELRREGTLSSASINHILQALRTILGQAVTEELIGENPALLVKPVKLVQAERGIPTIEEVRKLLASPALWRDHRHYTISLLAASTGARMGELRGLQVQNVFPDHLEIRHSWENHSGLKEPKWGSVRDVPIAPRVYEELDEVIRETVPTSFVFYGEIGKDRPMGERAIETGLYAALRTIGITETERRRRHLSFHSWRHFLNTALRSRGLPDSKLRLITGHRSEAMSNLYTHYNAMDFREVVELQEAVLQNPAV
jgi:integrase